MSQLINDRDARLKLIREVEGLAQAPVVVYFTADSPIVSGVMAEDALLPMFDHLRSIGTQKRVAMYLYSRGGVMETPWKVVTMLREFCDELHVIVPYKAHSAATMIAMGADKIYMTRKAELGPIDPALQLTPTKEGPAPRLPDLGVEDVAAYVTFVRERAKLTDQAAVAAVMAPLAQYLTPPLLGRLERIYSHIRLVARNLLSLHKPPLDDRQISAITEALTEKIYVHGHGIGRREASQMGLDVRILDEKEEDVVWSLYEAYEKIFRLRESADVESYFGQGSDSYERPETPVACIESGKHLHAFVGNLRAQRIRTIPPNPAINVNLTLNIPPDIQAPQLPQAIQQAIQQLLQQAVQELSKLVAQEIQRQSPVAGISAGIVGGAWLNLA
jgi:hypothetical protein